MTAPISEHLLSLVDIRQVEAHPENAGKLWELIEGKLSEKMASFVPSAVAQEIAFAIKLYLKQNPIGYVTGADGSYILSEHNRPMPDVGYISKARLPEIPAREVPLPPDLAVEVISPTDDLREVQKKAMLYLRYGVKMVWVVYPEDQTVDIYRPSESGVNLQTLSMEDVLEGGEILPNFTLAIQSIFAF